MCALVLQPCFSSVVAQARLPQSLLACSKHSRPKSLENTAVHEDQNPWKHTAVLVPRGLKNTVVLVPRGPNSLEMQGGEGNQNPRNTTQSLGVFAASFN